MNEYWDAIEEQIAMRRHDEWLIIGGDHDASVDNFEQHSCTAKARGKYGCGPNNEPGIDLMAWFELNGYELGKPIYGSP